MERRQYFMSAMFHEKLDVKLINLVKDNPVIYDFNHSKYMDFNAREVAWQKIGDVLKMPASDCKVRWINIRDVHRRILKKNLTNPGSCNRPYKYETHLAFMKAFYKDIVCTTSDFDADDNSAWDDDNNAEITEQQDNRDSDDSEKPIQKLVSKRGKRKRKKKTYEEEEKPEVTYSETTTDFDPSDPVDAFLISIGATLKTFNPYHLNLAKSKIFAVVQEHDLQQIVQKSNDVKMSTSECIYME
ncbi:unnamed protein product [Diatraea saccharalis]|uniref:MADF domain-containing protein n=1 Tax=Diatraea saccharalis TaxID=40085 RepID=A0A9N9RGS6_9NEOP|nr:unnamed protein product [Diatraea saccharalis]